MITEAVPELEFFTGNIGVDRVMHRASLGLLLRGSMKNHRVFPGSGRNPANRGNATPAGASLSVCEH